MLFELKNKMPRNSPFLWWEDVLTSTIFGNLRYFSDQNILIDFLIESIDINKRKLDLERRLKFEINFWEKHFNDDSRRYNETDLTLENDNYIIIIECKYRSPLSGEDQLIRYSKILLDKKYTDKNKIVIFLTEDKNMPEEILIKSKKDIENCVDLYWLSWNKLYLALKKQNINKLLPNELLLYNDLIAFLVKRNLITFEKFIIENISCNFHYRKKYRYIDKNLEFQWYYKKYYNYNNTKAKLIWRYKK
jgi:hypothetical protein